MKTYIVSTHLGDFETTAKTAKRALANIRWRVFGGRAVGRLADCWTVREKE